MKNVPNTDMNAQKPHAAGDGEGRCDCVVHLHDVRQPNVDRENVPGMLHMAVACMPVEGETVYVPSLVSRFPGFFKIR